MSRMLSVIVPCRNERAHLARFLDALAAQRLPQDWTLEVLVADGHSDDGTREQLDARARGDARLLVVDNPGCIVSTGPNATQGPPTLSAPLRASAARHCAR